MRQIQIYDTTLRDGTQSEGFTLSSSDKVRIAQKLDELGVTFIEGGWPGANPTDTAFFAAMADGALTLRNAQLVSFGFTRRVGMKAADDPLTAALREARAPVACIVAKSHDRHVEQALHTTLSENLAMIGDTVRHLRSEGQRVFVDCEHFFDGFGFAAYAAKRKWPAIPLDEQEKRHVPKKPLLRFLEDLNRKLPLKKKGPIQLQTHGGEIRWRNLRIRELPSAEANALLDRHNANWDQVLRGVVPMIDADPFVGLG